MGHLNSFSASGGGNLNKNFSKNTNARGLPGGMLKLRFDWYISLHVHRLWISLLIEFSSKTDKRNITKKISGTFVLCLLTSSTVVIIVSKWVALVWRKTDFGQSIWHAGDQTTAFTILNCVEYEFLKGFLVQGQQQSFWKFSVLSNILDLQWCRPNEWKIHSQLSTILTCRDGKGGKLSSQASKMLYKPPGAVYI